jgi:hypothetical protein
MRCRLPPLFVATPAEMCRGRRIDAAILGVSPRRTKLILYPWRLSAADPAYQTLSHEGKGWSNLLLGLGDPQL